mmetsp:Transcript_4685/g.7811  ORF Transcript_4685/g.7811 Transcript_4685/m.7811 type:complete len:105 (-) Transcript_4685:550-864(-)
MHLRQQSSLTDTVVLGLHPAEGNEPIDHASFMKNVLAFRIGRVAYPVSQRVFLVADGAFVIDDDCIFFLVFSFILWCSLELNAVFLVRRTIAGADRGNIKVVGK